MTAQMCEWFARCDRPAAGVAPHPVLGAVPTCAPCAQRFDLVLHEAAPQIVCTSCGGALTYRVTIESQPAAADNFDQLSDHRPAMFTHPTHLASVAAGTGQLTVRQYTQPWPSLDPGVVIAYAGPDPETGGRIWFALPEAVPTPKVVTA